MCVLGPFFIAVTYSGVRYNFDGVFAPFLHISNASSCKPHIHLATVQTDVQGFMAPLSLCFVSFDEYCAKCRR